MKLFVLALLAAVSVRAFAYDCASVGPFDPFETETVAITVDRFFWTTENGQPVQRTEAVCATSAPMEIGVYDIRGREADWYYCFYQTERPRLDCETTYNGKPALLMVRPAAVIRSYPEAPGARDTHAHIFLVPENDWNQYRDTFVRSMSFELSRQDVFLDSVSGGQGPNSHDDSFGVRLHYY